MSPTILTFHPGGTHLARILLNVAGFKWKVKKHYVVLLYIGLYRPICIPYFERNLYVNFVISARYTHC